MLRAFYRHALYGVLGRLDGRAGGKDRVLDRMPRASLLVTSSVVFVVALLAGLIQPAAAGTPLLEVDVASFSSRAQQWVAARETNRSLVREQAIQLAEGARQSEEDRLATQEADRVALRERELELAANAPTTERPASTTTAAPPATRQPPSPPEPSPSGEPTAAQWEALRQCESSGNYAAVSANGRYRGAYQFSQETWDWVAGVTDRSLIGTDPASASPAQQDAVARGLWDLRGWPSWPSCSAAVAAA